MHEKNKFIKNTACPKCRETCEDRSGDNLANYSDGGSYCWKCGHFTLADNIIPRFLSKGTGEILDLPSRLIHLPDDSCLDYPTKALSWLEQYELSRVDLLNNGVVWSASCERLIFPFWDEGNLLGWQGRYFGNNPGKIKKNKWYGKGRLLNVQQVYFLGKPVYPKFQGKLLLTEDIISAIKVSKAGFLAMPLFGTNIKSRWAYLRLNGVKKAILWLDPDMYTKMIIESRVGCLNGVKTTCVLSTKDPKEHSYNEIQEYLKGK